MWDFFKGVAMALVPPHDAEGEKIFRWRLVVAGLLLGVIMATGLHIIWACGYLASFGLNGFARADDMIAVRDKLDAIQIGQIRTEILTTRTTQCQAIKSQNQQALTIITRDLQDALDRYQTLTRRRYDLPDCAAL